MVCATGEGEGLNQIQDVVVYVTGQKVESALTLVVY